MSEHELHEKYQAACNAASRRQHLLQMAIVALSGAMKDEEVLELREEIREELRAPSFGGKPRQTNEKKEATDPPDVIDFKATA
jgi:hypothetical protein